MSSINIKPVVHKRKRIVGRPTPKQKKLIKLIVENLGRPHKTKSFGQLMLEAGYSKAQSKNPFQILRSETIKIGISDFTKTLDDKRKMAITHLTGKKLKKAPAREVAYVIDILTKNFQLLSGGGTGREEIVVKWK